MTSDPLYQPLGINPPSRPPGLLRPATVGAALLCCVAAGVIAWGFRHGRPGGAELATAVASITPLDHQPVAPEPGAAGRPAGAPVAAPKNESTAPALPPGSSVEIQNGVKIIRFNPSASSAPVAIPVEGQADGGLAPAPDRRVSEQTANGVLPRVGTDGSRAATVYARAASAAGDAPRVALVLAGMGRDQSATADLARRLSGNVDFAFRPDIEDAGPQVNDARRAGHEVVMDLRDPAAGDASATLLRRLASWPGYVATLMLPARAGTDGPIVTGRGVDLLPVGASRDGSAGTDLLIDGVGQNVASALDQLVARARAHGHAVGVIEGNAATQADTISFVATAASRGVVLVPLSAVLGDRSSAAR